MSNGNAARPVEADDRHAGGVALMSGARVEAVKATGLLDSEPEEAFDRLTRLAADLIEAPMVFVTLVDDRRSSTP